MNSAALAKSIGQIEAYRKMVAAKGKRPDYSRYRDNPVGFCTDILRVTLTPLQQKALELLLVPPYRVLVPSANEQGKTFFAACGVLWWFCTRSPSIIRTTAPTADQIKDLLWKEIRSIAGRAGLGLPFLPKACRIERSAEDFAEGRTARDENAFKGQHGPSLFFIGDEATGIDAEFWTAIETMFSPPGHAWLMIFNPTSSSSQAYVEYKRAMQAKPGEAGWHIVRMSALDHPNIAAELAEKTPPFPHAIRLAKLNEKIPQWSTRIMACDAAPTDVEWPPGSGTWYRPGPLAEVILLGRYPSMGSRNIWGELDWEGCNKPESKRNAPDWPSFPQIGCDIARYGDDNTALHVRWGHCSVEHIEYSKAGLDETVGRIILTAKEWAKRWSQGLQKLPSSNRPHVPNEPWKEIPIKVDVDGLGAGVVDMLLASGMQVVGVSASAKANSVDYKNRRSELWFNALFLAREGKIDTGYLDDDTRNELGRQAGMVEYAINTAGELQAESKDDLKKRLKRSPDGMDAMNLGVLPRPTGVGAGVRRREADLSDGVGTWWMPVGFIGNTTNSGRTRRHGRRRQHQGCLPVRWEYH